MQQAITWAAADTDLCCHIASLGHNELTYKTKPDTKQHMFSFQMNCGQMYIFRHSWTFEHSWAHFYITVFYVSASVGVFKSVVHNTMPSYEHHAVSNHRSFNCVFNRLCGPTSEEHQSPHYWPFVRGIHRWPVNSHHKGPLTRKTIPFVDVIMKRC